MFLLPGFQGDVTPEPAALEDEARGRGQLANIFPQNPPRFPGVNPIARERLLAAVYRREQLAPDLTLLIDLEQVFVYSAAEEFVFPCGQRRPDPKAGMKFCL